MPRFMLMSSLPSMYCDLLLCKKDISG
jgi:hypothetical protein